jgi:hypothetical protein
VLPRVEQPDRTTVHRLQEHLEPSEQETSGEWKHSASKTSCLYETSRLHALSLSFPNGNTKNKSQKAVLFFSPKK